MSESKNILQIYFYRIMGLIVGFGSILFVIPLISSNQEKFAIYAICSSLCMFLTYGDFGFLGACSKYCAEAVGREDLEEELDYIGFTLALLGSVAIVFSISMIIISQNPSVMISSLDPTNKAFASNMFLLIGLLMPIQVLLQRTVSLILSVRLKDFLFFRLDIMFNLAKILIVPLFVDGDNFQLLEYFATSILISCTSGILGIFIIRDQIKFPIRKILYRIKFSSKIFKKFKSLAFSSMISTIFFIFYYEFDLIIAVTFFSIQDVAYFALAFTFLNFFRSLLVIIFAPYLPLLNVRLGEGKMDDVRDIVRNQLEVAIPLFIITVVILSAHMDTIVLYWVGRNYMLSAEIISILLLGVMYVGYTNVGTHYITTMQQYKQIVIGGLLPFLSYFSIFGLLMLIRPELGILNLAYAKMSGGLVASLTCLYFLFVAKMLDLRLILRTLFFSIFGILAIATMPSFIDLYFTQEGPSTNRLIALVVFIGLVIFIALVLSLLIFRSSRSLLIRLISILPRSAVFRR